MRSLRRAALLLAPVLAAACGGGGGGGGSEPPGGGPPNPPPPAFVFTAQTATAAARIAMSATEQMMIALDPLASAPFMFPPSGRQERFTPCGSVVLGRLTAYADNDGNGAVSVGDVVLVEQPECDGQAIQAALTVRAFDYFGGTLEGEGTFTVISRSSELKAEGKFHLSYSGIEGVRQWQVSDVSSTLTDGEGGTHTVTDAALTARTDLDGAYRFELSGAAESAAVGAPYTYTTPVPLEGVFRRFPEHGELVVAVGGARARVTPTANPGVDEEHYDLALDLDGTGFDTVASQHWSTLVGGSLFFWWPNQPPVITLTFDPPNPTAATDLVTSYTAFDPEGVQLEVRLEYRRNGVLLADQAGWYLPRGQFQRGDVVEVTVIASDGKLVTEERASLTIGNAAPTLGAVTLTPAAPYGDDDLVVSIDSYDDADGDAVGLAYEWRRNGALLAGETGATLPASATRRDDVITVTVIASDGMAAASTEPLAVTIQNSPYVLAAAGAPAAIAYGAPAKFQIDVTDLDGDPTEHLRFEVTHGPAGMTVDAMTGEVAWPAAQPPMFDRQMTVHWGVAVDDPASVAAAGTIVVTDPAREYPRVRSGIEGPVGPAGLSIGDFDGDGGEEMLILSDRSLFELAFDGTSAYRQTWVYPFALGHGVTGHGADLTTMTALTSGDADGDDRPEVFVAAGEEVFALDGAARRLAAHATVATRRGCRDLRFADLDGAGSPELVCLIEAEFPGPAGLAVFDAAGLTLLWRFPDADYGGALAIGDVDGDSALEIVTAGGYVFDGASYANEWLYGPGFGVAVDTGDVDGDGRAEIVAVGTGGLVAHRATMPRAQVFAAPLTSPDAVRAVNVDGDAAAEIVVADAGEVRVYDYDAGSGMLGMPLSMDSQGFEVSTIGAGDLDDDGELELVWGTRLTVTGADDVVVADLGPSFEVEWINGKDETLDGPFVGGALAGSALVAPAPLFATERTGSGTGGTRLIAMDPSTGDLDVSGELPYLLYAARAFALGDHDADGGHEVFLGGSDDGGSFAAVYDAFAGTALWRSGYLGDRYVAALAVGDMTGDRHDDLVAITHDGVVMVHDVFQQTLVWQSAPLMNGRGVALADLDGDGTLEILAITWTGLYAYERAGPASYALAASYTPPRDVRDAIAADVDGDGEIEVIALTGAWGAVDSSSVEWLSTNLQLLRSSPIGWRSEALFVEPSAFARKNLLVPSSAWNAAPTEVIAVDARHGREVWRSPRLLGQLAERSLHFVEAEGRRRVVIGTQVGMYLTD